MKNTLDFDKNTNITITAYKLSEIITSFNAYDTPNDQGGSVTLNWSSKPILNFDHFNIYIDTEEITSVKFLRPINSTYINQLSNSLIISELSGKPLENNKKYYFAITVVDSDGNENWDDPYSSDFVIPKDDLIPEPVTDLNAFDTPNDNGDSITVTWAPVEVQDFDYYELYCVAENITEPISISSYSPKIKIKVIDDTEKNLTELTVETDYYIFILVYDINGNANLSVEILGPIIPIDNIPPLIDRTACDPPLDEENKFYTDVKKIFEVNLVTTQDIAYRWYLDGNFYKESSNPYILLIMAELDLGKHNLTVIAEESSGLQDSVIWNFTVSSAPGTTDREAEQQLILSIALAIIIIVILIVALFGIRYTFKYKEARKTIRTLPDMNSSLAIELIERKRSEGDKYTLVKLTEDLPEALKDRPDKLFFLLSILVQDNIIEVRRNAAKNIARLLDKHPNNVFSYIRVLLKNEVQHETFDIISESAKKPIIKNLAKRYYLNLIARDDEEYISSLEETTNLLQKTGGLKFGSEMFMIYATLNDFYKYRTVSRISTTKPILDEFKAAMDVPQALVYPEVNEVFRIMGKIADTLGKYEKVEGVEDKLSYLSQGISWIEEASKLSRDKLLPPEREYFILVLNSWRNIISMSIRELRGRAELSLTLKGKEVIAEQRSITIMLEIRNRGRSIAERVLVEVVPADEYAVISKPQHVGTIGQKKRKEVTFELKPRTTDAFRVAFAIRYDDAERKGKSISFADLVTFIEVGAEFNEIPNPYIVGTPIRTGSKLFVGRRDLIEFIQKNIRGSLQENIIVLIGHRRTGKTTLLQQLPVHLDTNFITVYIDIQGIIDPGMDAFFYLLATEIVTAMQDRGIDISTPEFEQFEERPSFYFEYKFLKEVYQKLGKTILVIMFDEFEELQVKVDSELLDKNIFSYLRHLMQHTKQLAFIFTGSSRLEDLKTDYWSIMFNIALYKRISFLSETETKKLITEPVKGYNMIYDSLAVEKIYRLTFGHPYFTQLLCHSLVNLHNRMKKNYITIQDVNGELDKIIERGQMHFDFIWDQATIFERLIMAALTRIHHEEESVTVSSIVNKLKQYDLTIDAGDITKVLDLLISKDILKKNIDHTVTYEFNVDLIRIWLERTKHLDQVVEEYRSGV